MLKLTRLDLSSNQMSSLDSLSFQSVPNLEHLNLANNQLTYLNPSLFAKLAKLKTVSFKNNPIVKQQSDYVKGLFTKKQNPLCVVTIN